MTRLYALFAILLLTAIGYANLTGWILVDTLRSGKWGPHGRSTRLYHK